MTQKQQIENHRQLSEKRIVVLGGSSGIGLAVAQQVVAQGARAIIASSKGERVKQAVATLDGKAEGYTLDLSQERDIQDFFQQIGDFDHLVFTAGDTLQLNELAATDRSSQESADRAVQQILSEAQRLDVIIHNAGHMVFDQRKHSPRNSLLSFMP